jgi:hypothetical protein
MKESVTESSQQTARSNAESLSRKLEDREIAALTLLLAGEIAAVETYRTAIQKIKDIEVLPTLGQCLNCHASRITTLRNVLEHHGITPPQTAGPWGTFASLMESAAMMLSDTAAIAVLAAGEYYGLETYRSCAEKLDADSWRTLEKELLPAQEKTQQTMSLLNRLMRNPN